LQKEHRENVAPIDALLEFGLNSIAHEHLAFQVLAAAMLLF
jgi:hypothetical protein